MASSVSLQREAKYHAGNEARRASPRIERMARSVYVPVGALATRAAFGGEAAGRTGVVSSILSATLGRVLLGVVFAPVDCGLFMFVARCRCVEPT